MGKANYPGRNQHSYIREYVPNKPEWWHATARPKGAWDMDPKLAPLHARRKRPKGRRSYLLTRKAADRLCAHPKARVEYKDWLSCSTRIYVQRIRRRGAYIEIVTLRESVNPIYSWNGPGDTYIIHRAAILHMGRPPKEERPSREATEAGFTYLATQKVTQAAPLHSGVRYPGNRWAEDAP